MECCWNWKGSSLYSWAPPCPSRSEGPNIVTIGTKLPTLQRAAALQNKTDACSVSKKPYVEAVQMATIILTVKCLLFSCVKSESPYYKAYAKVYQLHLSTTPDFPTSTNVPLTSLLKTSTRTCQVRCWAANLHIYSINFNSIKVLLNIKTPL